LQLQALLVLSARIWPIDWPDKLKATTIMSLEEILRVQEHGTGPIRDPELYFVSVFGAPDDQGEWGWRVEGHHLALNFTLRAGRVVSASLRPSST
jgi:hypothetical protein